MKSFKVQFFNKSGNLEEIVVNADTESAASMNNRRASDEVVRSTRLSMK